MTSVATSTMRPAEASRNGDNNRPSADMD
jgi:hypothetical protein